MDLSYADLMRLTRAINDRIELENEQIKDARRGDG